MVAGAIALWPVSPRMRTPVPSRVKSFHSIDELRTDASAIVLASSSGPVVKIEAGGATLDFIGLNVIRKLGGNADVPSKISTLVPLEPKSRSALVSGSPVLLFIDSYETTPGVPRKEWVVVGDGAGVFVASGARYAKTDSLSVDLPNTLTVSEQGIVAQ